MVGMIFIIVISYKVIYIRQKIKLLEVFILEIISNYNKVFNCDFEEKRRFV